MIAGTMEQVRALLSRGETSRDVIEMGYAPGTVYKVQRELRRAHVQSRTHQQPGVLRLDAVLGPQDEGMSLVTHITPPPTCLICGKVSVHWLMCTLCNRLIPADCDCSEKFTEATHGWTIHQLVRGSKDASTHQNEITVGKGHTTTPEAGADEE